jgi:hypothetical protein
MIVKEDRQEEQTNKQQTTPFRNFTELFLFEEL